MPSCGGSASTIPGASGTACPAATIAAASRMNSGPYGATVSRQIGGTAPTHVQGSVSAVDEYGLRPFAYSSPWQLYE